MVDKGPGNSEFLTDRRCESLDPECFGCVMASVNDVDPQVLRMAVAPMRAFPRNKGVNTLQRRHLQIAAGGARAQPDLSAKDGTSGNHDGGTSDERPQARGKFDPRCRRRGLDSNSNGHAVAVEKGLPASRQTQSGCQLGGVSPATMPVERQMLRVDGQIAFDQTLEEPPPPARPRRAAAPKKSMVHDEQVGVGGDRQFHHGEGGVDGGRNVGHAVVVFHLQPVHGSRSVTVGGRIELGFTIAHNGIERDLGHGLEQAKILRAREAVELRRTPSWLYGCTMTLEDSVGDIVRKARISAGLEPQAAAALGRVSLAAYQGLESTGALPAELELAALCARLGLSAERLRRIAGGWLPVPAALEQWRELRQIETADPEDGMKVNAYLAWDEATRDAALFDTGFDAAPIVELIEANSLALRHIFVTHSHYDHVAALGPLRERYPRARVHSSSRSAPVEQRNRSNDFINLGSLRVTNRETPGHAEDGVTYIVGNWAEDAPHAAMVGDAIFAGSIGGARDQLDLARRQIREQIFSLPAETLICPGHGPMTTVGEERGNNPWFPA